MFRQLGVAIECAACRTGLKGGRSGDVNWRKELMQTFCNLIGADTELPLVCSDWLLCSGYSGQVCVCQPC